MEDSKKDGMCVFKLLLPTLYPTQNKLLSLPPPVVSLLAFVQLRSQSSDYSFHIYFHIGGACGLK